MGNKKIKKNMTTERKKFVARYEYISLMTLKVLE
jgi:hypothetical protein